MSFQLWLKRYCCFAFLLMAFHSYHTGRTCVWKFRESVRVYNQTTDPSMTTVWQWQSVWWWEMYRGHVAADFCYNQSAAAADLAHLISWSVFRQLTGQIVCFSKPVGTPALCGIVCPLNLPSISALLLLLHWNRSLAVMHSRHMSLLSLWMHQLWIFLVQLSSEQ